jgi:nitrogen PTS system EIIA component
METNNGKMNNEIMTVAELAQYLKVSEKSVLRMVERQEIPVVKIASQWRFMRTVIDDWLITRMKYRPKPAVVRMIEQDEIILPLSRIVRPEHIIFHLQPGSVEFILGQLIEPLIKTKIIADGKKFMTLLKDREEMSSTALSNSVALPHARNPNSCTVAEPSIVVGICKNGTRYNALDGKNTKLFFLVCTDSDIMHLKMMSKLAFLMKDQQTIDGIIDAKNDKEVLSVLNKVDEEISSND